ncbi:MAG: phenylalanine--tRNA ligase subunit beta [Verrucomicrobia bacterium]|nr:MAG: phenylalanine--tRNA ligase subunit beta [Verrucomicrobiota bacterium]
MKLSFNWLLELVDFNGAVSDLIDLLTRAGCKVESVETRGVALNNVVVAEILESEPHPNADRLSICKVADGTSQTRQIVCGAKNYHVGDKVPLALPGAVLPGNFKIQVGKLRGVESQGMLCSAKELAIAEDAVGLLILPKTAPVGSPISHVFPPDSILDLEITPNRGDWLSHLGIAREVSVFTNKPLNWQPPEIPRTTADPSKVRIEDQSGCSTYALRQIRGVQVGESPAWLRSRLEAVGLHAVNNIVDITNYVMLLLGQPLHAFDANRVKGGIVVARGISETNQLEFQALDGKTYSLASEDIIISDAQGVLALGGIIGGKTSGVSSVTTDIILESAIFDPARIRRTARRLGLSTHASYRFERGVDNSMMLKALELAAQLICEIAGGMPDASAITAGYSQQEHLQLKVRHNRINRLLGLVNLQEETICAALKRIGLKLIESCSEFSIWEIPSYRRDLTREVDLIEEVARILGIEAIPEKTLAQISPTSKADANADFYAGLHNRLIAQGFFEARTSTLVNYESFRDFVPESQTIRLKNPLGADQAFLRPSLIPGLLSVVQRNFNHGQRSVRLYEIGKVFRSNPDEEIFSLGLVMTGASASSSWKHQHVPDLDLYDLKGTIQTLITQPLFFTAASVQPASLSFPPGSVCLQILTTQLIGLAGQLAPAKSRELGIPGAVLIAELLLRPLQAASGKIRFSEIPRYPEVQRDIAAVVLKSTSYENIENVLFSAGEALLTAVQPFDIFIDPTGEKLPADRKSVAVSLKFRSLERTLTNEEVTSAEERLKQQLITKLGAEFRE